LSGGYQLSSEVTGSLAGSGGLVQGLGLEPSRPPFGSRSDGISATILERDSPGDGGRQGVQVAEHDLDDVAMGIADIARLALPSEPAVEEELQEIEGQHPDQKQCVQGRWGVTLDMFEVPVTSPLVEGGVLDVPAGAHRFQRGGPRQRAGTTGQAKTPGRSYGGKVWRDRMPAD
jgi:hypothetical protein